MSYDDWSNPVDNSPYTYDFYSETLRTRKSFNQEFRLLLIPSVMNLVKHLHGLWILPDLSEQNEITDVGTYINPFSSRPPYIKNVTGSRL